MESTIISIRLVSASRQSQRRHERKHRLLLYGQSRYRKPLFVYSDYQQKALAAAQNLATTFEGKDGKTAHSRHVTRLALCLFDELYRLHHLGVNERFYLECAGLLHDIGWIEGWKGHHKRSLGIILQTSLLPFDNRERLIIGAIARYHTRALPSLEYDHFAALQPADRRVVLTLSALLRLADGLDRSQRSGVESLMCKISRQEIHLIYTAPRRLKKDQRAAHKNSDLLASVFQRRCKLKWRKSR